MSQETIGPGRGPNGAKPHMVPIGINQGTAPGPVLPEYTLRQDYPNSWLNRPPSAIASRTYKATYYRADGSTTFQIARANPNRIKVIVSHDGTGQVWINNATPASFQKNIIQLSTSFSLIVIDAETFGRMVIEDLYAQGQITMNFSVVEVFQEPFDPRVTRSLFP